MFTTKEISHSDRIKLGLKRKKQNMWIRRTLEWTAMVNIALISSLTINSLFEFKLQAPLTIVHNPKSEVHASEPVKELSVQKEKPMRDYVLDEVEKAGLDRYEAYEIISCESGWNPHKVNPNEPKCGYSLGLWQIYCTHNDPSSKDYISEADSLDYKKATAWAINKRLAKGSWSPTWSCATLRGIK